MNAEMLSRMAMPDDDWDKAKKKVVEMTKASLGQTDVMPTLFVFFRQWDEETDAPSDIKIDIYSIAGSFNEHEEKAAIIDKLAKKTFDQRHMPIALIFVSEAWQSTMAKCEALGGCMPRNDPDKKEILCAAGLRCTSATDLWSWAITVNRDDENRMVLGGDDGLGDEREQTGKGQATYLVRFYQEFARHGLKPEHSNN